MPMHHNHLPWIPALYPPLSINYCFTKIKMNIFWLKCTLKMKNICFLFQFLVWKSRTYEVLVCCLHIGSIQRSLFIRSSSAAPAAAATFYQPLYCLSLLLSIRAEKVAVTNVSDSNITFSPPRESQPMKLKHSTDLHRRRKRHYSVCNDGMQSSTMCVRVGANKCLLWQP